MAEKSQSAAADSPTDQAPGLFSAAWSVLKGQRLTPLQIEWEWLQYKQTFDDVLSRLGAQLARKQKLHNEELKRLLAESPSQPQELSSGPGDRKDALRQRFAVSRGLHVLRPPSSAQPQVDQQEESP